MGVGGGGGDVVEGRVVAAVAARKGEGGRAREKGRTIEFGGSNANRTKEKEEEEEGGEGGNAIEGMNGY